MGRRSITLNEYDKDFAIGWNRLGEPATPRVPHWDEVLKRQGLARLIAVIAVIAGGVLAAATPSAAARVALIGR